MSDEAGALSKRLRRLYETARSPREFARYMVRHSIEQSGDTITDEQVERCVDVLMSNVDAACSLESVRLALEEKTQLPLEAARDDAKRAMLAMAADESVPIADRARAALISQTFEAWLEQQRRDPDADPR